MLLMNILGIETSCDETAAAVVRDGTTMLSNIVASQIDIHQKYGGVVPEIAARSHIEAMQPVIQEALDTAKLTWDDIDGIAVTRGPGLIGSLLIGTLTARTLALVKNKPLYGINHVEAHVYANWLIDTPPTFPLLALIVSGGHTQLALFRGHEDYELLGQTQDDAVGEAFDKAAKVLGLPYPGGPSIAKAATQGNKEVYTFTKPKTANLLDFSYSGLKTALLRAAQKAAGGDHTLPSHQVASRITDAQRADLAASFQATAIDVLVDRLEKAYMTHRPASVVIAGGVAASQPLRDAISKRLDVTVPYPPMSLCTDNAAMIAARGYFAAKAGQQISAHNLVTDPSLSM